MAAQGWTEYPGDVERTHRALTAPGVTTLVAIADGHLVGAIQVQSDGVVRAPPLNAPHRPKLAWNTWYEWYGNTPDGLREGVRPSRWKHLVDMGSGKDPRRRDWTEDN